MIFHAPFLFYPDYSFCLNWHTTKEVTQMKSKELFAKHGGVHFINQAPAEEINRFVRELPEEKRESLFEVLSALDEAGLIQIQNDGIFADGEGKIGGSSEC